MKTDIYKSIFKYFMVFLLLLGATFVPHVVEGIQSQHVIANAKHFVNNNQETNRKGVSANVDERTEFEIYYPPFEAAFKAGVAAVTAVTNGGGIKNAPL